MFTYSAAIEEERRNRNTLVTNYHHHDTISDLDCEMKETESKKERDRELLLEDTHIIIITYELHVTS